MSLKIITVASVLIISVQANSNCNGYFECVRSFLNNFFSDDTDTIVFKVDSKNRNVSKVNDVNVTQVDRVLKDLSTLLNIGRDEKLDSNSGLALYKNVDNRTQIYVNVFEFDRDLTKTATEDIRSVDPLDTNVGDAIVNGTEIDAAKDLTNVKENLNSKFEVSNRNLKQNEIIIGDDLDYYDGHDDNSTDYPIIDYVDFYQDTTNEEYVYVPTEAAIPVDGIISDYGENKDENNLIESAFNSDVDFLNTTSAHLNENERDGSIESIFPWIVTIFIKNDSENNQFAYYCDGALLTKTKILTAARCVNFSNSVLKPEDLLIVLGKSSLQQMAEREKVSRIKQIVIHEDFTDDDKGVKNDLAILIMDEPIKFTEYIKPVNISSEEDFKEIRQSATTAWAITGRLEAVLFEKVEYLSCVNDVEVENALCASYGYDVALCPSYGGLFAVRRQGYWQLEGIMSGNPSKRGICYNKSVTYTYLENYLDWIIDVIDV